MNDLQKFLDFVGQVEQVWILISILTIAILAIVALIVTRFVKSKKALVILLFFSLLSGAIVAKFESSFFLGMIVSAPTFVIFVLALVIKLVRGRHISTTRIKDR